MNILTAEEFLKQEGWYNEECSVNYLMIEFAKMHVKAALENGAKSYIMYESDREKIRNSYPLENIK
jgi:hypothetical protein